MEVMTALRIQSEGHDFRESVSRVRAALKAGLTRDALTELSRVVRGAGYPFLHCLEAAQLLVGSGQKIANLTALIALARESGSTPLAVAELLAA